MCTTAGEPRNVYANLLPSYVAMIRAQRSFMVQTDEQYVFVHEVLVEAIRSGNTEISSCDFGMELRRLTEFRSNIGETLLEAQFKKLQQTTEVCMIEFIFLID